MRRREGGEHRRANSSSGSLTEWWAPDNLVEPPPAATTGPAGTEGGGGGDAALGARSKSESGLLPELAVVGATTVGPASYGSPTVSRRAESADERTRRYGHVERAVRPTPRASHPCPVTCWSFSASMDGPRAECLPVCLDSGPVEILAGCQRPAVPSRPQAHHGAHPAL